MVIYHFFLQCFIIIKFLSFLLDLICILFTKNRDIYIYLMQKNLFVIIKKLKFYTVAILLSVIVYAYTHTRTWMNTCPTSSKFRRSARHVSVYVCVCISDCRLSDERGLVLFRICIYDIRRSVHLLISI